MKTLKPLSPDEKTAKKRAKSIWRKKMKKLYPDFTKRAWANESYRIKHPQMI